MRLLAPLRERDFALLFGGTLVSLLGDGIYLVAVPFAVLDLSDSVATLSLVGLTWSIGMFAFLLVGGVAADRHDKRRQLLVADAVRLVALVVAGALSLHGSLAVWHLLVLSFVYGSGEGLSAPALNSIIPELVAGERLVQANALSHSLRPLALRLVGPALGAAAVALLGTGGALLADAGTFAVSMACLLAIRARPLARGVAHEPLRRQVHEAAAFVRSQPWLWGTLLAAAVALLCFLGPVDVLVPFRVKEELGGSAGGFGVVLAAGGAGSLVGTMTVGQLGIPRREVTFLYWVWGLATFALCGYALASTVWQLVLFSALFGLLSGAGDPVWSTLMQVRVPPGMRGRVSSLDWLVSFGLTPASFALVAPAAALLGARATLFAAGFVGGAATLALLYAVPGLRAEDGGLRRAAAAADPT